MSDAYEMLESSWRSYRVEYALLPVRTVFSISTLLENPKGASEEERQCEHAHADGISAYVYGSIGGLGR